MRTIPILMLAVLAIAPASGFQAVDEDAGPIGFAHCDLGGHVTWYGNPVVGLCCERIHVDVYYCYW